MARYIGPVCRICRGEGRKLFLKGERCNTGKCSVVRRSYKAGQHGQKRQKLSEYGIRLKEKQKLRKIYGILEKQFRRYYEMASRKKGVTGEKLLQLLETRLDNVVYKIGFASSRSQARQIVKHGHIKVNNRRVDIPSFLLKTGDKVQVSEKSQEFIRRLMENISFTSVPSWVSIDKNELSCQILDLPKREEIGLDVQENLVIEFYSR